MCYKRLVCIYLGSHVLWQSRIEGPVKHLWCSFFAKVVNGFKPLTISAKMNSVIDFWRALNTPLRVSSGMCKRNSKKQPSRHVPEDNCSWKVGTIHWKYPKWNSYLGRPVGFAMFKKWNFPLRISSVNVTKPAVNCRNISWKFSVFAQFWRDTNISSNEST